MTTLRSTKRLRESALEHEQKTWKTQREKTGWGIGNTMKAEYCKRKKKEFKAFKQNKNEQVSS